MEELNIWKFRAEMKSWRETSVVISSQKYHLCPQFVAKAWIQMAHPSSNI